MARARQRSIGLCGCRLQDRVVTERPQGQTSESLRGCVISDFPDLQTGGHNTDPALWRRLSPLRGNLITHALSTTAQLRHPTRRFEPRRREDAKERRSDTSVSAFVLASRPRAFAVHIDAASTKLRCSVSERQEDGPRRHEGRTRRTRRRAEQA